MASLKSVSDGDSSPESIVVQTGAIADQDGMVYTVGYNGNGEMGNGTIENLITPWCISKKKINVEENIINLEEKGNTKQIKYNMNNLVMLNNDEINNMQDYTTENFIIINKHYYK